MQVWQQLTCKAAASFLRRAMRRCTSSLGHSKLQQCCRPEGCTLKRMLTRCLAVVAAASRLSCRMAMLLMDSLQQQHAAPTPVRSHARTTHHQRCGMHMVPVQAKLKFHTEVVDGKLWALIKHEGATHHTNVAWPCPYMQPSNVPVSCCLNSR